MQERNNNGNAHNTVRNGLRAREEEEENQKVDMTQILLILNKIKDK